jgi:long-chain acyl-CoA synthetase
MATDITPLDRRGASTVTTADAPTIVHLFRERVRTRSDAAALRWRTDGSWSHLSWEDYGRRVAQIATGLRTLGCHAGDRVAILSGNRLEWHLADLGVLTAHLVSVPVYATSSAGQVAYMLEHSGARICFVENLDQLEKVMLHRHELDRLEHIVLFEEDGSAVDRSVATLAEIAQRGQARLVDDPGIWDRFVDNVAPTDLATLVYTSGTTGPPKGAMITHANLMATVRSLTALIELRPDDRYLSFLPLSHITERCVSHFGQIASGGETWFARSLATVAEDLQDCRPTLFFAVPRVWEKFRDGVTERIGAEHGLRRVLAQRYLDVASARPTTGRTRTCSAGSTRSAFRSRRATARPRCRCAPA